MISLVRHITSPELNRTYGSINRTLVGDSLGGTTASVYDADNRLERRTFSGPNSTQLRLDVTWTATDRLESLTRFADLAGTTQVGYSVYGYDNADRLTSLRHQNAAGEWGKNSLQSGRGRCHGRASPEKPVANRVLGRHGGSSIGAIGNSGTRRRPARAGRGQPGRAERPATF